MPASRDGKVKLSVQGPASNPVRVGRAEHPSLMVTNESGSGSPPISTLFHSTLNPDFHYFIIQASEKKEKSLSQILASWGLLTGIISGIKQHARLTWKVGQQGIRGNASPRVSQVSHVEMLCKF